MSTFLICGNRHSILHVSGRSSSFVLSAIPTFCLYLAYNALILDTYQDLIVLSGGHPQGNVRFCTILSKEKNLSLDFKRNSWLWLITLFCLLLGMLLAAALKTQENIRTNTNIPSSHFSGVVQALLDEKETNKSLRKRISGLLAKNREYESADADTKSLLLSSELRKSKFLAGLAPAEGEGVEVTLRDSTAKVPTDTDPSLLGEYIIHDQDLRNVVNELLANGAEAVSIKDQGNNQRITGITSIRCVGGVIQVNHVPMSPPFIVCAIGPKDTLESSLKMPGGMIERARFLPNLGKKMIQVKTVDNLILPSYSENVSFRYAKEAKSEGKDQ